LLLFVMSVFQVKFRKFSFTWMNNLYAIQLLEVVRSVENTVTLLLVSLFASTFSNLMICWSTVCSSMRDFRLPARCKWDLPSFGILRSVYWQFITDVSGQPIGPIFKGSPLEVGSIGCSETLVRNYNSALRKTLQRTQISVCSSTVL